MRLAALIRVLSSLLVGLGAPAMAASAGAAIFQPGFHQALRSSVSTSTRTTYRMKLPIGRAGSRVRLSFQAGDGSLTLHSATVALAGTQGALAAAPTPVTFGGSPGFTSAARGRVTSDPIAFPVSFGDELYVSFDVDGSLAASTINAFPDSYSWAGSYANVQDPPAGAASMRAVGLDTIDVEAPASAAFVALGDSITEGYVSGDVGDFVSRHDDYRNAWTTVAQRLLGLPVANAAVSGQGVDEAILGLKNEVFTLQGITDCLVLLGTNNLGSLTADEIDARLATLFDQLRPFCRIWAGTLLPKETTTNGVLSTVIARRLAVNDWIRHQAQLDGVIDFEPALAAPGDVNHFAPGLGEDGIHPSIAGQAVMGQEAARVLTPPPGAPPPAPPAPPAGPADQTVTALEPPSGPAAGGVTVHLTGTGFTPGVSVTFGGIRVEVMHLDASSIEVIAPEHAPGPVDVQVTEPDGRSTVAPTAFVYEPPGLAAALAGGGCNGSGSVPTLLMLLPLLGFFRRRSKERPGEEPGAT
jgi:lysophospholipase L1-like esterase